MRITVTLYRAVPRHLILQRILLLILPKSEPGQLHINSILAVIYNYKKIKPLLGKSKRILFEK